MANIMVSITVLTENREKIFKAKQIVRTLEKYA